MQKIAPNPRQISPIYLPPEIQQKAIILAKQRHCSVSDLVVQLLTQVKYAPPPKTSKSKKETIKQLLTELKNTYSDQAVENARKVREQMNTWQLPF